jgi:hypothetical protein
LLSICLRRDLGKPGILGGDRLASMTPEPSITAEQWLASYASALGTAAPSAEEMNAVLALAGVAAHASERKAAPVACWLAARAGIPLDEAMRHAKALSGE